jgi:hypothetical protein
MTKNKIADQIIHPKQSNFGNVGAAMVKAAKKA